MCCNAKTIYAGKGWSIQIVEDMLVVNTCDFTLVGIFELHTNTTTVYSQLFTRSVCIYCILKFRLILSQFSMVGLGKGSSSFVLVTGFVHTKFV